MTISPPGRVQSSAQLEVLGRVDLVGVDEHEVERRGAFGGEQRQRVERGAHAHFDGVGKTGPRDVGAGQLGVARVGLERDDATVVAYGTRQPDRAVAAERADLEHRARADRASQQVQQLALGR